MSKPVSYFNLRVCCIQEQIDMLYQATTSSIVRVENPEIENERILFDLY
jgi:hypothetical protein